MLHDPARHEALERVDWDERAAAREIEWIVRNAEEHFSPRAWWPVHPLDGGGAEPVFNLYFGAAGVIWALHYLEALGAARLRRSYAQHVDALLPLNRAWLRAQGDSEAEFASYLMGDTAIVLLAHWLDPSPDKAARLEQLIAGNLDHPARELMWGAPGTLLAALLLHRATGEARWAELYRATARKLWSQLRWSPELRCHYWVQDLYGESSTYLDAVHGFVATASPLIRGRHLLDAGEWAAWQRCIVDTVRNTAQREDGRVNWPAFLPSAADATHPQKKLMQHCHGAPGFVVCLAELPGSELDADLIAAGEAIWAAGPLAKGSNLCHGTGGNGYAFLKLHRRTGDARWLERARAFAMHGIAQTQAHARRYGQLRYSLWTGDPGFAIYLRDCIGGSAAYPTLDVFFPSTG